MIARLLQLMALVTLCLLGSTARAEPRPEDRATARRLAREGHDALERREYALAADCFRRADELVHAPTLVVDRARALIGLGRLVEAHELYEAVRREGVTAGAPSSWKKAVSVAERERMALAPRLAWLEIEVTGADAPTVFVDGRALPSAAIGVKRAVDPGTRRLAAARAGYLRAERTVTLAEGEEARVELALRPEPEPEPEVMREPPVIHAARAVTQPRPSPREAPARPAPWERDDTLAHVSFVVGGAGFITAGVGAGLMLRKRADLQDVCRNGRCPASSRDDVAKYKALGKVTAIGTAVGVAGAVTGVTLLLLPKKRSPQPERDRGLSAVVKPSYVGLKARF